MNTRIHSFKVYRIETLSGMKFWTFFPPKDTDLWKDVVLQTETLSKLTYIVKDGEKDEKGKSLVRKSDLEFLISELVFGNGLENIASINE